MSSCSVIIVSYQSGPILFAVLKRVLVQANLQEVLVVDNGNAPHLISRLQQMSLMEPRLRIIGGKGNIGVAKASNLAAEQAVGDYLLFLQPDCLIAPDALVLTMQALQDTPSAMVAGARILNADGSAQVTEDAYVVSPKTAFWHMLRFRRPYVNSSAMPDTAYEVSVLASTYLCISKMHFTMLGGFDEAFFLCIENIELCRRANNMGKKVIFLPYVIAVHLHASTERLANASSLSWWRTKGLMYYFKKHDRKNLRRGMRWGLNMLLLLNYAYFLVANKLNQVRGKCSSCALRAKNELRRRLLVFLAMGLADLPESTALAGRQVLLTGATGQIGLCVLRRLIAEGASVVALTRQEPLPFLHERVWWVQGDLSDAHFILPNIELDVVVHCAPLKHLPKHMARLMSMGVTRALAFGSTALFSQSGSKNWHEKELVDDLRVAELEVETLGQQLLMRWTILRPTLVYGMDMGSGIARITRFIRRFRFFPLYPPALGKRHPVHADDLAKAVILALDTPATYNKAYNLSGADVVTFQEMVERIFASLHYKKRIINTTFLPFALDVVGKLLGKKEINAEIAFRMNDDLIFFHDIARTDFGFSPRGFMHEGQV